MPYQEETWQETTIECDYCGGGMEFDGDKLICLLCGFWYYPDDEDLEEIDNPPNPSPPNQPVEPTGEPQQTFLPIRLN